MACRAIDVASKQTSLIFIFFQEITGQIPLLKLINLKTEFK